MSRRQATAFCLSLNHGHMFRQQHAIACIIPGAYYLWLRLLFPAVLNAKGRPLSTSMSISHRQHAPRVVDPDNRRIWVDRCPSLARLYSNKGSSVVCGRSRSAHASCVGPSAAGSSHLAISPSPCRVVNAPCQASPSAHNSVKSGTHVQAGLGRCRKLLSNSPSLHTRY